MQIGREVDTIAFARTSLRARGEPLGRGKESIPLIARTIERVESGAHVPLRVER